MLATLKQTSLPNEAVFKNLNRFSLKSQQYEILFRKVEKFERALTLEKAVQKLASSHFQGMLYFSSDTDLTSSTNLNFTCFEHITSADEYIIEDACDLPKPHCRIYRVPRRFSPQQYIDVKRAFKQGDVCFFKEGITNFTQNIEPYNSSSSQAALYFKIAT